MSVFYQVDIGFISPDFYSSRTPPRSDTLMTSRASSSYDENKNPACRRLNPFPGPVEAKGEQFRSPSLTPTVANPLFSGF